jgi:cell division protein FtsZ
MAGAPQNFLAVIKVIGVGGAGVNAINRMIDSNLRGVEFVAVNTDAQALLMSDADFKIDIGREITRGLGAGSDPAIGQDAAEASRSDIEEIVSGADMVFITAGEGGGTGTGAAPIIAEIARAAGALTVGIVTRPFGFEGRRRAMQAEAGIAKLRDKVDTLIIIPNERLLSVATEKTSLLDAFKRADEVLLQGVAGITNLITTPGLINTDFADVKMILIEGARGILLNITGPSDMGLFELNAAAEIVHAVAHQDANIIFGTVINDELEDEVQVTVIAAGFDRSDSGMSRSSRGDGRADTRGEPRGSRIKELFGTGEDPLRDSSDGFDVPDFLK